MIRINAGKYRGKKIPVPQADGLRPTTDRTRAAMFNLLMHRLPQPLEDLSVLDAFAGSGALGFECVSRGAQSVTLVENNPSVVRHLHNASKEFGGIGNIVHGDLYTFLKTHQRPFDLILLDPPFNSTDYDMLLQVLAKSKCTQTNSMIVIERPTEISIAIPREFAVDVDRAYGRSSIIVATYEECEPCE